MGKKGIGYGSEYHLSKYRQECPAALDAQILKALNVSIGATIEWIYPLSEPTQTAREPQGLSFLKDEYPKAMAKWAKVWPQRGRQPSWDGIARLRWANQANDWLLVEAKANHPEFCSPPTQASRNGGRAAIERRLNVVKRSLGVYRYFSWVGSYYQHANRLACLHFLNTDAKVPARLLELYFVGDSFPDNCPCPSSETEWQELIRARDLTLGLPKNHSLCDRVHHVFLPLPDQLSRE